MSNQPMAWLRTSSDRVVITRSGFTFSFVANVPREIPDDKAEACIDAGCLPAEAVAESFVDESFNDSELNEALHMIIAEGNLDDFKADKTPKHAAVNSLLTKKRTAKDIANRFAEIMNGGNF